MKKTTTFIAFLVLALGCFAQQGEIIYTKFDPDWCLESIQYAPPDSIKLDFDNDGVTDFVISMFYQRHIEIWFIPANGWGYRVRITDDSTLQPPFQNLGIVESDTIVSYTPPWGWCNHKTYKGMTFMCGVRKVVNDSTYYYGWFDQTWINASIPGNQNGGTPYFKEYECVHDMAFCTIPNYPLRWGQTSLTSDEDNKVPAFAVVHPNPTKGTVTVTGKNLRQAVVANMQGQRILSVQGEGNELHINMTSLPAGIYLINIIDAEGRKCVQKVVKQ
jgi:hypothetical protein